MHLRHIDGSLEIVDTLLQYNTKCHTTTMSMRLCFARGSEENCVRFFIDVRPLTFGGAEHKGAPAATDAPSKNSTLSPTSQQ